MANHATDAALIQRVQAAANAIGVASRWSNGAPLTVADSFLLEMFLLFRIVEELRKNYTVVYDPGEDPHKHEFPQNGADKGGRPRFIVRDKTSGDKLYQVCAGTKASDIDGNPRALDVSIQKGDASSSPTCDDVLQIFDAKYRQTFSNRISSHEFSEFVRWIENFELRGSQTPGLNFAALSDLDANCLVTNGECSTELDAERNRKSVREIFQFHPSQAVHSKKP